MMFAMATTVAMTPDHIANVLCFDPIGPEMLMQQLIHPMIGIQLKNKPMRAH
jgi:hypothetical protein